MSQQIAHNPPVSAPPSLHPAAILGRLLLLSALSTVIGVLLVEGLARLVAPSSIDGLFPDELTAQRPFVRPDPELGFLPAAGYADQRYRINADGFRGRELPRNLAEHFVVLCAGDSTTFGWQVGEGDDFPALLGDALRAHQGRRSWVVNGGVPSYTSSQVLRKLERDLPRLHPDLVVITMPWNDMWDSALPSWRPEALVVRMPGPWMMWLMRRSAAARAVAGPPRVRPAIDQSVPEALDLLADNLGRAVEVVRRSGGTVIFQTAPFDLDHVDPGGVRFDLVGLRWGAGFIVSTAQRYTDRFQAVAGEHAVPLVDNPVSLASARDLFLDMVHPTRAGYARMAAAVIAKLAEPLVERGEVDEAIAHYEDAHRLDPGSTPILTGLTDLLIEKGELRKAADHLSAGVARAPEAGWFQYQLAEVLGQLGEKEAALEHYEKAIAVAPNAEDKAELHAAMAAFLMHSGRREEAIAHYGLALTIDPAQVDAHWELAEILSADGKLEAAAAHYREVLRLDPERADAATALAKIGRKGHGAQVRARRR